MGSFLVKSGFLLVLFGDGRQKSASLVFIILQEHLCLILRQLDVLQLLQQVTLLLWKTAAHWTRGGKFKLWKDGSNDEHDESTCTGPIHMTDITELLPLVSVCLFIRSGLNDFQR